MELGVPEDKIYIENESTNTGDNFRFTKNNRKRKVGYSLMYSCMQII